MTDVPHETPTEAAARQWWADHPGVPNPLEALHGGWPFGPGPDRWAWNVQAQAATEIQPEGLHLVCSWCNRSITRLGAWSVTLESLKPQIAAHVMQVHPEHVTG